MTPMISMPALGSSPLTRTRICHAILPDLFTVAGLVGLDVAARLLPHAPDFTPVAATALFAACALRLRALSLGVPLAAMLVGDAVLGFYDWRVAIFAYGALLLPACAASLSRRLRRPGLVVPVLLSSSLAFFLLTNFAVWAFSPIYAANAAGLVKCYVAALPFLQNQIAGDLFWGLVLLGPYWFMQGIRVRRKATQRAAAVAMPARP
jgi:Family of unknown function (DUF6580)